MSPEATRNGFLVAGATNILGILLFSKGMTNEYMSSLDPQIFSVPGWLAICVWGLAYIALAPSYAAASRVSLVFALEKALYFGTWAYWLTQHGGELGSIWATDPLTAIFFAVYGLIDAGFCLFFAAVWWRERGR